MNDKNISNESMVSSEIENHFPEDLPQLDKSIRDVEELLNGDREVSEKHNPPELNNDNDVEDVEDTLDSDDLDNDVEDDQEETKPTKGKKDSKFWHEKREKYAALRERDRLVQENTELMKQRNEALEIGNYHYGRNVAADLEFAKEAKKKAMLEGDYDTFAAADEAIYKGYNAISEVEKWKTRGAEAANSVPEQQNYQTMEQSIASDWLLENPEMDERSEQYNSTLANKVISYANNLEKNMDQHNQSHLLWSPAYLENIDNYIVNLKSSARRGNSIRPISANSVAPVRKNYGTQPGTRSRSSLPRLNDAERKLASNMGISEANWRKSKQIQINKTKEGR